jgi:hypothetical protein
MVIFHSYVAVYRRVPFVGGLFYGNVMDISGIYHVKPIYT